MRVLWRHVDPSCPSILMQTRGTRGQLSSASGVPSFFPESPGSVRFQGRVAAPLMQELVARRYGWSFYLIYLIGVLRGSYYLGISIGGSPIFVNPR